MWSPKLAANGQRHRPYELMRLLSPGDVVFSYAFAEIRAIGIVQSTCYEFPKPIEFGSAGQNWSATGWRVDVSFRKVAKPLRTMDHIDSLRSFLPKKHSPIKHKTGGGNENYLFDISEEFALALAQLLDPIALSVVSGVSDFNAVSVDRSLENISDWEDRVESAIKESEDIEETERLALISARRGQGKFRATLLEIERSCRITGVDLPRHLVASHTKPWRDSTNEERLDPENGFMLTPTVDHLFDKGFISFEGNGDLLISPVAHETSLLRMGVSHEIKKNVGTFSEGQKQYLSWHRDSLFLSSSMDLVN